MAINIQTNNIVDPSETGIGGLKGLNTKEGRERYFDSLGLSRNISEFKARSAATLPEYPIQEVGVVGLGDSIYDEDITSLTQLRDLSNTRGELQPWYSQIGAGLGKGTVLAGTTFLDGTIGTIVGAINMIGAAASDKNTSEVLAAFWDNPFAKAMKAVNDWSEEAMPNHMTNEELKNQQSGEWYKNIWTANWWGNSFIKNLGFTVGAFATGNLVSGALKGAPAIVKSIVGSGISALNEGKIEAYNNATDWYNLQEKKLNDAYKKELEELKQNYGSLEVYDELKLDVDRTYQEALVKLNQDKAHVGNVDLALNIPILTASNFYMWGKLYAGGARTAINSSNIAMRNGKYIEAVKPYKIVTGPISEGSEEMGQKIAATIPGLKYGSEVENFYLSKWDPDAAQDVLNWNKAVMQGIAETVGDPNSWEEFTIGAMTGMLGMPMFRSAKTKEGKFQSPITIEGGIIGEVKDYLDEKKRTQELVNRLNERVQDPKFRDQYLGLVRHTKLQNDMNNAAAEGDVFEYKNAEDSQLVSDIIMFDKAGKLNDLIEMINQAFDTSDKNIQAIINSTTGPFSVDGNSKTNEEVKQKLTDTKNNILEAVGIYKKSKDDINYYLNRAISGRKERTSKLGKSWNNFLDKLEGQDYISSMFNDDAVEELTWLNSKTKLWTKRFNSVADEVRQQLATVVAQIKYRYPELADKVEELDRIIHMPNDLMELFLGDPKNKPNMDILSEISQDISNHYGLEYQDLSQKLQDMVKLAKAKRAFNQKLKDYIDHPEKIQDKLNKDNQQIQEAAINEAREKLKQKVNEAKTFKDIEDIESEESLDDELLNNSPSQVAKDYKRAKIFKTELDQAIDKSTYSNEQKQVLHNIANKRFQSNDNLSDLMNLDLITDSNIIFEDGTIINDDSLAPFILEAKKALETRREPTSQVKTTIDKAPVDTDSTGSSETSTVPTTVKSKPAKILDLVKDSIDAETVSNLIVPLVAQTEEVLKSAISTKEQSDIDKAIRTINTLLEHIESLPEASDTEFRTKLDKIIDEIDSLLPESNPEVTKEQLLSAAQNDNESQEMQNAQSVDYYRSDLTQFEIDSMKEGQFMPYIPSKESVKIAQSRIEYDYINKGNVKVGDTIELKQETIDGDTFTFMYHNNHIVGVLPLATNPRYKGIKGVNERLSKGEKVTLTVSKVMLGKYKYDRTKTQSVKDVASLPSDVKFGVMKPTRGKLGMTTNTDDKVEPVYDELHSDGKVYLLLPNSRGTLSPKLLRIKHFNQEEFPLQKMKDSGNTRAIEIDNILQQLSKADNPDQVTDLFIKLGKVLYLGNDFHMNLVNMGGNKVLTIRSKKGRKNIVVERGASGGMTIGSEGITYDQPQRVEVDKIYNQILEYLYNYNTPFNIQANKVNTGTYNTDLLKDDILYTHITDAEMLGSWFTTTWYDDSGIEQKSVNPKGQFNPTNNKTGTKVTVGGKQYYVDKGIVYDANENEISDPSGLIKDLAFAKEAYGDKLNGDKMSNGKVLLPSGKGLDVVNQKYLNNTELQALKNELAGRPSKIQAAQATLTKMQEDYKKVKRDANGKPDTSENESGESVYRILEEDGQYHEYRRVHSVIGSNWIDDEATLTQDEKARRAENSATALKWGQIVDDICRAFFANEKVTRPEGMSEAAFNTLINKLKQVKANLEINGEQFLTNRIVVFKKYPDGTRVAGELDALAYNPITGTFNIYDFKTSKRAFWVTGNARDLYRTKGSNQTRSDFEQHSLQLSAYKNMFDSSYESSIGSLAIMPFVLTYNSGTSLNQITPQNGIILPYQPTVPVPTTKDIKPINPPVTNPANAILNPKNVSTQTIQQQQFSIGDKVSFQAGSRTLTGTIKELKDKLATIITEEGKEVNVTIGALKKTESSTTQQNSEQNKDNEIYITNTYQGLSRIGTMKEWSKKASDIRNEQDGFGTKNGIYYYKKSHSGRNGDNITIWFRQEPSQEIKDNIEQLLSTSKDLVELGDTLYAIINKKQQTPQPKSKQDQREQQGETSYFELNGEVVTGLTTVIGNIQGHEIRMYKQKVVSKGLNGLGGGVGYDFYAVFPNGATFRFFHFVNISDEEAGKAIIDALNKNIPRTLASINATTKVGSYSKPDTKKSSLKDAANKLNGTNKQTNRGETQIAEKPEDPKVDQKDKQKQQAVTTTDYNPMVNLSWEDLPSAVQQMLQLGNVTQDQWDSLDNLDSRQALLNCK